MNLRPSRVKVTPYDLLPQMFMPPNACPECIAPHFLIRCHLQLEAVRESNSHCLRGIIVRHACLRSGIPQGSAYMDIMVAVRSTAKPRASIMLALPTLCVHTDSFGSISSKEGQYS